MGEDNDTPAPSEAPRRDARWPSMLAALGVVYGDIGTSPLYAIRECFHGPHAISVERAHVLGVLSLVFWALVLVISVKYLLVVMRADNRGEGGILALTALACPLPGRDTPRSWPWVLALFGIFGAALLYGDGMITPAISVLSAVEGLSVAAPTLGRFVVPLTLVILVALFALQRRGTAGVGKLFGPVTLLWFVVIAVLGVGSVVQTPTVLAALSPHYAVSFMSSSGGHPVAVIGTVFLVVTGGEALYADMGHFGARPIRGAWFRIVLPALVLNYFGQGALLLREPQVASNPFYHLAPRVLLYPLVLLATAATIIASQAVITGAFSLTWQALQLGYLPRLDVHHTSPDTMGQIYIPSVNWLLLVATAALVLGFGSSSALAGAYGVAVSTTMVITTVLLAAVMRRMWKWSWPMVAAVALTFIVVDLVFFGANIVKVPDGGWFPLAIGGGVLIVMTTWRTGRRILGVRIRASSTSLQQLLERLTEEQPTIVPGTAVFLTGGTDWAPPALLRLLTHVGAVHEQLVLFTVVSLEEPYAPKEDLVTVERVGDRVFRVVARCGYMERPHVPTLLSRCAEHGLEVSLAQTTYVLGRETLLAEGRGPMARWRERLFALLVRNASGATLFYGLPAERVLEIGAQIAI